MSNELVVDFCGEAVTLAPGTEYTFGRDADLCIDDNRFLHRHCGVFRHVNDGWWLENLGSQISLTVVDAQSPSSVIVSAGRRAPLTYSESYVRFGIAQSTYEIALRQRLAPPALAEPVVRNAGHDTVMVTATVRINDEQRMLLVALGLPWLRDIHDQQRPLPSNIEVMNRLGWTKKKFDHKLDYLCTVFDKAGWRGLVGGRDSLATQRRQRLVRAAIDAHIITVEDIPADW
jgi:hypothetical protein